MHQCSDCNGHEVILPVKYAVMNVKKIRLCVRSYIKPPSLQVD